MSKKIIDWDELRAELLSDSKFRLPLMQKSARNACGRCWRNGAIMLV